MQHELDCSGVVTAAPWAERSPRGPVLRNDRPIRQNAELDENCGEFSLEPAEEEQGIRLRKCPGALAVTGRGGERDTSLGKADPLPQL